MFKRSLIKAIEKETTKKLQKHYRPSAYFYIEKVSFDMFDADDTGINLHCRTGYDYKREDGTDAVKQIYIDFNTYGDFTKTPKDYAIVLFFKIVEVLDEWNPFEVRE